MKRASCAAGDQDTQRTDTTSKAKKQIPLKPKEQSQCCSLFAL